MGFSRPGSRILFAKSSSEPLSVSSSTVSRSFGSAEAL